MLLVSKLAKDLSKGNSLMAPLIWFVLVSVKRLHFTFVSWWIVDLKIKFNRYYLIMASLMKRQMDTQIHHQIWLGGEDQINTGRIVSSNVSHFINLLYSRLSSYGFNFRVFKGLCITSMPVARVPGLASSCCRCFQSHLRIGLETFIRKQSRKLYLQFLSRRLYIHWGTKYCYSLRY